MRDVVSSPVASNPKVTTSGYDSHPPQIASGPVAPACRVCAIVAKDGHPSGVQPVNSCLALSIRPSVQPME